MSGNLLDWGPEPVIDRIQTVKGSFMCHWDWSRNEVTEPPSQSHGSHLIIPNITSQNHKTAEDLQITRAYVTYILQKNQWIN